jgi:hypothetical protein
MRAGWRRSRARLRRSDAVSATIADRAAPVPPDSACRRHPATRPYPGSVTDESEGWFLRWFRLGGTIGASNPAKDDAPAAYESGTSRCASALQRDRSAVGLPDELELLAD